MAETEIQIEPFVLRGTINWPERANALVVFAHGSGSSRLSPCDMEVAQALNGRGTATFLFDLLTREEESDRRVRTLPRLERISLSKEFPKCANGWPLFVIPERRSLIRDRNKLKRVRFFAIPDGRKRLPGRQGLALRLAGMTMGWANRRSLRRRGIDLRGKCDLHGSSRRGPQTCP